MDNRCENEEERTLPRPARGHSDISHMTRLHDVVEGLHLANLRDSQKPLIWFTYSLFNRGFIVKAVALEKIYILKLQARKAVFDRVKDVLRVDSDGK
jgi:hypothetical protein